MYFLIALFISGAQAQDVHSLLPACQGQPKAVALCEPGIAEGSLAGVLDLQKKLDLKIFLDNLQNRVKVTATFLNSENQMLSNCAANTAFAPACAKTIEHLKTKIKAAFPNLRQHMTLKDTANFEIAMDNYYKFGNQRPLDLTHIFSTPAHLEPATDKEKAEAYDIVAQRLAKKLGTTKTQVIQDIKTHDFANSGYAAHYNELIEVFKELNSENLAAYNQDLKALPLLAFLNNGNPSNKEIQTALIEFNANSAALAAKKEFSADELAGYLPMILQILSEDPTKCTAVEAWLTEKYGRDQAYGILKAVMAGGLLVGCVTGAVVAGAATVGTGAAAVAAVCTAGGLGLTGLTVIDAVNAAHEERLKAISSALSADFVTDFNKLSALERDQLTQLILAPTAFIGGVAGVKGAVSLLSKLRPQVAAEIVGGLPATVRSEISAVAAAGSKELGPGGEIKVDWVVSLKNPSTEDVQNMAKAFKEAFGSDTAQFKGETIGHNPINTFYASDEAIVKVSPRIDAKDPTAGLNEVVTYERWGFEAEAGIEKMISSHVQNYQAQGFVAVDPKFKYFSYGSQVPVSNPLPDIVGKQVRGFQNVIMENRAVFFEGQVTRTFMDSNGHVFVEITGANENFTVQLSREFGAPDLWVKP